VLAPAVVWGPKHPSTAIPVASLKIATNTIRPANIVSLIVLSHGTIWSHVCCLFSCFRASPILTDRQRRKSVFWRPIAAAGHERVLRLIGVGEHTGRVVA